MSKIDNAGAFKLISFNISKDGANVDATNIVHMFSIQESMSLNSIRGSAKIYDSTGLLYTFPLTGEETIDIEYSDWFGDVRKDTMFLYAITDVKPSKEADSNTLGMTLHFVSKTKFLANRRMVRKSYTGLISTIAGDLFDAFYDADPIQIEGTTGFQRLSIPNMLPDDAMNFLSRRAYSSEDESSMIRFFENRNGHFFMSPGYYARNVSGEPLTYGYNALPDQTGEGQLNMMSQLIEIDFNETVNTIADLNDGNYNASTIELDILKRQVEHNQYKYLDEYQAYTYPNGTVSSRHNKSFMDESAIDPHVTVILKDYGDPDASQYPGLRPNTYEHKTYTHKYAAYHHLNANKIFVKIYGRNSIVAGSTIDLDLPKFMKDSNNIAIDPLWSGRYFIEAVDNVFFEDTYTQSLTLSKSGVSNLPEPPSNVPYMLNETNADVDKPNINDYIAGQI
ncbi:MAG: hypothetical protein COA84_13110 [Robiginitomaculum sp.]|nr:MAG: hypothetical protein COA84_13110 [Robiginitomaculum sp.]